MLWIGILRLTVIFLVIVINKGASGAVMNNEELTNVVTKLEKTIEADQLEKRRFEATISDLQFELESVKNKSETNEKLIEEEQMNMNQTKTILLYLEKQSQTGIRRIGTSCWDIANLGNLESGTFLLDTDADGILAPYEAYCKMPERTTIVGNDVAHDFGHCNKTFCSEKNITFDAPLPQLGLLMEKSPSCHQTITFECQSAPIMMLTQNGDDITYYMQWRDRKGDFHNVTSGDNCNKMWPHMTTDTIVLTNNLLPVTTVRYGPLFEWQKAKILVSKLKCDSYEEQTLEDRFDQIDIKITNVNSKLDNKITNLENRLRKRWGQF